MHLLHSQELLIMDGSQSISYPQVSNSAHLGPTLASSLDDDAFLGFLGEAGECADSPVPNLVFTGGMNKTETRLPSLTVEGVWRSSMNHSLDDITLCTNTGIERY